MGNHYNKPPMNNKNSQNSYEEPNNRQLNYKNTANNNKPVGGQHGYNFISHQPN